MTKENPNGKTVSYDLCANWPSGKVPLFLKPFANKTPAQFLGKFFSEKTIERLGGLFSGIFTNFGVTVPTWTTEASRQFWKYYGLRKDFNAFQSVEDFGVLVRLIEDLLSKPSAKPESYGERFLVKTAPKFISFLLKKGVSEFSDLEKAQFYTGKHKAGEIIEKLENQGHLDMVKLAPLYLAVSVHWKKIEAFETHAARERWLREEKVIKENVELREVYQAFSVIGLPGAKSGKPKTKQTEN